MVFAIVKSTDNYTFHVMVENRREENKIIYLPAFVMLHQYYAIYIRIRLLK